TDSHLIQLKNLSDGTVVSLTPDKTAAGKQAIHRLVSKSIGGLEDGVTYYVKERNATDGSFKLSATPGGAALTSLDTTGLGASSQFTIGPEGIDLSASAGVRHTLRIDLSTAVPGSNPRLLAPGGLPLSAFSPVLGDGVSTATAKG